MFKTNDGYGDNAIQNRFTAMLVVSTRNKKLDFIEKRRKSSLRELSIDDYEFFLTDSNDFVDTLADLDVLRSALKLLDEKERNIIIEHIVGDKDFAKIGLQYGLTYKGTATVFYRAVKKIRNIIGRFNNEF